MKSVLLIFLVLGIEVRIWAILRKHSTTELNPQPESSLTQCLMDKPLNLALEREPGSPYFLRRGLAVTVGWEGRGRPARTSSNRNLGGLHCPLLLAKCD